MATFRTASRATSEAYVLRWLLVSGALAIRSERQLGQVSTAACGTESQSEGHAGRARCWVLRERPSRLYLYTDRDLLIYRMSKNRDHPYLENCTVDASIICSCQVDKGTR